MTDAAPPAPDDRLSGEGAPPPPGFRILAQYTRDFSFENPRAPESLRVEGRPQIDMGVEMNAQGRKDGLFEVDLKLSIKATAPEGTQGGVVFNVELVYGGLFQLMGVSEQDIEPLLLIECPRYLFPFAREVVAKATADGGFFPPFYIDPIDFAAIYMQRKAQIAGAPQEIGQA